VRRQPREIRAMSLPVLQGLLMRTEKIVRVKALRGFKPSHKVPKEANEFAEAFVLRIADSDLGEEISRIVQALRASLRLKRRDLNIETGTGAALIRHADFSVGIQVLLDASDPSRVFFRTELINLSDAAMLLSDEFNAVFTDTFDTVEFQYEDAFDVEAIIDALEEADDARVRLAYPVDASTCDIRIQGYPFRIAVSAATLTLLFERSGSPRELLESLQRASKYFRTEHDVALLPPL